MGGVVGHLYHLYDNPELTFGEIKEIFQSAAAGTLEKVTEKLDGINLVFTWDESTQSLKVARSAGDIKKGGMNAAELSSKFEGRGNLSDAFNSAFEVLNSAIAALPDNIIPKIFGRQGNYWYSMELIYSANPNVIQYDDNNVVFHGWPVFRLTPDGSIEKGTGDGVDFLVQHLEVMQSAIQKKNWKVRGPALVNMKKMSDGLVTASAIRKIDIAMNATGVGDSNSIRDYIYRYVLADVQQQGLPQSVQKDIAARIAGMPGAPNLTKIKSKIDKKDVTSVQNYVRSEHHIIKSAISPIESAVHEFAIDILKGLSSSLVSDSAREVERLRKEIEKTISAVKKSNDETMMQTLYTHMKKLGSIENLSAPIEGIVFLYKGNAYKFTGAFAPANQILGLFRYSRSNKK